MYGKTACDTATDLRLRYESRKAAANRGRRIGDRVGPAAKRHLTKWVRSMIVEAMSATIAATFYACDYSTKPNMVCAPLLVAVRDGLRKLEQTLDEERERMRLEELGLDGAGPVIASQPLQDRSSSAATGIAPACASEVSGADANTPQPRRRRMTQLEREASRRLIRQNTAAQKAQVKGNCLMAMQMLTRREVIRSHYPWQLMLKHAVWRAFETKRQLEGGLAQEVDEPVAVTLVDAHVATEAAGSSDVGSEAESAAPGDAVGADAAQIEPDQQTQRAETTVKLRRLQDNFYSDYLHRGEVDEAGGVVQASPLRDMPFYAYGMWVRVVPGDPWALAPSHYAFDAHHAKFSTHVQELREGPVVPYLHGVQMPTRATVDGLWPMCGATCTGAISMDLLCMLLWQCNRIDTARRKFE